MTIFVSCAIGGFFLVFIMLIFGGDTDMADMDADFDGDGGAGILSIKVIALAVCGWGVAGGLARYHDISMFGSSLLGLIGAIVLGGLGMLMMRIFYGSQTPFVVKDADYTGVVGRTLYEIPENGVGQVICSVKGITTTLMARGSKGIPIPKDTPVKVIGKQGGIVTVTLVEDSLEGGEGSEGPNEGGSAREASNTTITGEEKEKTEGSS
jgi:hypothetical protein